MPRLSICIDERVIRGVGQLDRGILSDSWLAQNQAASANFQNLAGVSISRTLGSMDLHLTPEQEARFRMQRPAQALTLSAW